MASVHDFGLQALPRGGDTYHPAPDYWKVVEARRPVPHQVVETRTNIPVQLSPPQQPSVRLAEVDDGFFDDEAGVLGSLAGQLAVATARLRDGDSTWSWLGEYLG